MMDSGTEWSIVSSLNVSRFEQRRRTLMLASTGQSRIGPKTMTKDVSCHHGTPMALGSKSERVWYMLNLKDRRLGVCENMLKMAARLSTVGCLPTTSDFKDGRWSEGGLDSVNWVHGRQEGVGIWTSSHCDECRTRPWMMAFGKSLDNSIVIESPLCPVCRSASMSSLSPTSSFPCSGQ